MNKLVAMALKPLDPLPALIATAVLGLSAMPVGALALADSAALSEKKAQSSQLPEPTAAMDQAGPEATAEAAAVETVLALRAQLKQTIGEHGPYAPQLVPVLSELAAAELAIGEKEYAAARLEQVIDLIRQHEGHYSQSLMLPLLRLANIYMGAQLYERAIAELRYAQHLTHRSDGVYSLEQVALIEELAKAFLGQDESDEAQREMRLAFNLSRRVHGEDSVEHVPGMLRFAAWYRLIGEDRKARRLYHQSIDRLEAEHGPDHYSLIEPLTHLAATASLPSYYQAEREDALLRADRILGQQAGVDAEDQAASAVRIGDFYTHIKQPDNAETHYQRAWELLAATDDPRLDESRIFAAPVVLNFPHAMLPDTRRGLKLSDHEVTVTYELDIDAAGKVTHVDVVAHSGPISLNRSLLKTAFTLRFRPPLQDGLPVATENFRMTESIRLESPVSRSLFMEQLRKEMDRLAVMLRVRNRLRYKNAQTTRR